MRKNLTYQVKCEVCSQTYIGETHRTLHSRISRGHLKGLEQSDFYDHFLSMHKRDPQPQDLHVTIIEAGYRDTLQRKAAEKQHINNSLFFFL